MHDPRACSIHTRFADLASIPVLFPLIPSCMRAVNIHLSSSLYGQEAIVPVPRLWSHIGLGFSHGKKKKNQERQSENLGDRVKSRDTYYMYMVYTYSSKRGSKIEQEKSRDSTTGVRCMRVVCGREREHKYARRDLKTCGSDDRDMFPVKLAIESIAIECSSFRRYYRYTRRV